MSTTALLRGTPLHDTQSGVDMSSAFSEVPDDGSSRVKASQITGTFWATGMLEVVSCDLLAQAGVFNYTGHYEESILHAGDAGFAPVSSAHYFKNVGDEECFVVLMFNNGQFTNIDATALVGNMPAEVSRSSSPLFSAVGPAWRW